MCETIKAHAAKEKTCPIMTPSGDGMIAPFCLAQTCLWWCGEEEGYCVMKILEPLAEALMRLTKPTIYHGDLEEPRHL